MPELKSFLSNKNKSIVESALEAFCALTYNSGKVSSLWLEFINECKAVGKSKKIGLYHQRRFVNMGYNAGTVVHHKAEFISLLDKYGHKNQLTRACTLYIKCDFILESLAALSRMVERVSLPFLELCQKTNYSVLLDVLPRLFFDLKNNNLETLKDFFVNFHLNLGNLTYCQEMLMKLFSNAMATGLKQQRGREFGIFEEGEKPQQSRGATNLALQNPHFLNGLLTHNLDAERDLSIFDRMAKKSVSNYNETCTATG